ncbi:MAG TPA: BrxA/BrxB family bacilliredoxin [Terriglobales bacterium]|nr:BrxA/BrxB family bacilliredoxin [Terriglobales bacterium]
MYPELMLIPMREELTRSGVEELRSAREVDEVLGRAQGTVLVVVNSVCGCAAGRMRPAVRLAAAHSQQPDRKVSVFAGQDAEATERARSYFAGYPPSSPSLALLKDGELVMMLQRHDIESRDAEDIAEDLKSAFNRFCRAGAAV